MAAENLFSCLTPFSETYELKGYILMDINRMEWIACVACLSGNWSRLLLKSKVLWWWSKHGLCGVALCNVYFACFTPGMNQKRETDLREGLRFLLARSGVSGFTRPDEFDLCGCCCCEAPRIDRSFSNRWSHLVGSFTPHRAEKRMFRHFNPLRVDRPCRSKGRCVLILRLGLGSLESVEDYLLPRFIDGNPISKYVTFAVLLVEPSMVT